MNEEHQDDPHYDNVVRPEIERQHREEYEALMAHDDGEEEVDIEPEPLSPEELTEPH